MALRRRSDPNKPKPPAEDDTPAPKPSAAERTADLPIKQPPATGSTVYCEACKADSPASKVTNRPDGTPECPECGAPITGAKKPEEAPVAKKPLPPAYCDQCGALWPRGVNGDDRPFPNCGHKEGFVDDPRKAKQWKPPAGHPLPDETALPPSKVPAAPPAPAVVNVSVTPSAGGGFHVRAGWGDMKFSTGQYQNLVTPNNSISYEVPAGGSPMDGYPEVLKALRQMADLAFAEEKRFFDEKLKVLAKENY